MEETQVTIYGKEDLKKSGGFKKKNNVLLMGKTAFFKYLKSNGLTIEADYYDSQGNISNDKKFKCSFSGLIVGTSSIVKEFKEQNERR